MSGLVQLNAWELVTLPFAWVRGSMSPRVNDESGFYPGASVWGEHEGTPCRPRIRVCRLSILSVDMILP